MNPPVPKIRTAEQLSLFTPVPDSSRTAGQFPLGRPVLSSSSLQRGQAVRAAKDERARVRQEFAQARAYGIARRHAAKLARNRNTIANRDGIA